MVDIRNLPCNNKNKVVKWIPFNSNKTYDELNKDEPVIAFIGFHWSSGNVKSDSTYHVIIFRNRYHFQFLLKKENESNIADEIIQYHIQNQNRGGGHVNIDNFKEVAYYNEEYDAATDLRHWIFMNDD